MLPSVLSMEFSLESLGLNSDGFSAGPQPKSTHFHSVPAISAFHLAFMGIKHYRLLLFRAFLPSYPAGVMILPRALGRPEFIAYKYSMQSTTFVRIRAVVVCSTKDGFALALS
jgi:hypothetical protein